MSLSPTSSRDRLFISSIKTYGGTSITSLEGEDSSFHSSTIPPPDVLGPVNENDATYLANEPAAKISQGSSLGGSLVKSLVQNSFRLGGKICSSRHLGGTASVSSEIFNLIKNIVGCGVLSLPSGIAAFANKESAVIPASIVIVLTGLIFGYYFLLIGRICQITFTATYREAWENTVGEKGSVIISLINCIKPGMANLSFSIILADTLQSLMVSAGFQAITRTYSLVLVTFIALLPLCLLKNLKVLTPFSVIGLCGMIFAFIAITIRYFDGSYDMSREGKFVWDLPEKLRPDFGSVGAIGALSPKILVLVCMLFEAFIAHYNAPRFYVELENNSIKRFGTVVTWSFSVSSAFFIAIAVFGFLTFGGNSNGYILNNYSTNDRIATMSRVAIFFAVLFSYPVVFIGFRDGVLDLLKISIEKQTAGNMNLVSVILLFLVTTLAEFITDLGIVNAVGGGSLGTAIVFIFPSLMFRSAVQKLGSRATSWHWLELRFATAMMYLGITVGVIGVYLALTEREN